MRTALYFVLVAGVSLVSLLALIRQMLQERDRQIKSEFSRTTGVDRDSADPADVLIKAPSRHGSLLPRYLMIAAHTVVFLASLALGIPTFKSVLYARQGNSAFTEHNYDAAVKAYDSALSSSPYAGYLHARFQDSLAQRDANTGGLGDLRRMVGLHPGDEGAHNNLGNALMEKGDLSNAILEYQQAVALKPDNAIFHNNLGNALQVARRYKDSIAELRQAIKLNPNQLPTYYNLANTLMTDNQTDEAITAYHNAIDKNPELIPAYYNLAQALAKKGRRSDAVAALDTFLQLAPQHAEFANAVAKAKAQLADWRKAQ